MPIKVVADWHDTSTSQIETHYGRFHQGSLRRAGARRADRHLAHRSPPTSSRCGPDHGGRARLSDAEWLAICEAAKLIPDADARAEIERCLFVEYPAFAYDAKRVAAAHRRGLQHARALQARSPTCTGRRRAFADDIMQERDLYYIERLRRRALALVIACQAIRRANRGRSDPQREWLISRLCGIWLDNFDAPV